LEECARTFKYLIGDFGIESDTATAVKGKKTRNLISNMEDANGLSAAGLHSSTLSKLEELYQQIIFTDIHGIISVLEETSRPDGEQIMKDLTSVKNSLLRAEALVKTMNLYTSKGENGQSLYDVLETSIKVGIQLCRMSKSPNSLIGNGKLNEKAKVKGKGKGKGTLQTTSENSTDINDNVINSLANGLVALSLKILTTDIMWMAKGFHDAVIIEESDNINTNHTIQIEEMSTQFQTKIGNITSIIQMILNADPAHMTNADNGETLGGPFNIATQMTAMSVTCTIYSLINMRLGQKVADIRRRVPLLLQEKWMETFELIITCTSGLWHKAEVWCNEQDEGEHKLNYTDEEQKVLSYHILKLAGGLARLIDNDVFESSNAVILCKYYGIGKDFSSNSSYGFNIFGHVAWDDCAKHALDKTVKFALNRTGISPDAIQIILNRAVDVICNGSKEVLKMSIPLFFFVSVTIFVVIVFILICIL